MNVNVIDLVPLQLYLSALIFAPTQSIIRKAFQHERTELFALEPEVESDWDAKLQILEGHEDTILAIAFAPDSSILASASKDRTVRLWDASTGALRQVLPVHTANAEAVAFAPSGEILASASADVRLWDVSTGTLRHLLTAHTGTVNAVAFAPCGSTLASASDDGTLRLWDVSTGAQK
jgi:WD40 repeat protein